MTQSLHLLLHQIVDYAGLFPPAGLPMAEAVANYGVYRRESDAWMLGRFVVPVARLREFTEAATPLLAGDTGELWRLSALAGPTLADDVAAIAEFNRQHAGAATIDAVELKATSADDIDAARRLLTNDLVAYVEIPLDADPRPLVERLGAAGLRAKARTGGLTPAAFPSAGHLARFVAACVAAGVPFKATAGLHHPLRADYRLTYAPDSPTGAMHGYLNVFLAAALLRAGGTLEAAEAVLRETDPSTFVFDEAGVSVRGQWLSNEHLGAARRDTAIAFGSCSFREPVDELRGVATM